MSEQKLLEVRGLSKSFSRNGAEIRAVDGISFTVGYGETLGLVGESGCGKSTTGRLVLDLIAADGGQVIFEGKDIRTHSRAERLHFRKNAQIIFQDCYASLSPRMRVGSLIEEALSIHHIGGDRAERREIAEKCFQDVALSVDQMDRYPHEFSGGQRQRIGIARALCLQPKLIVCDEPVSALDVSVQAQIVNMMMELQKKYGIAYLFISHDLSVVKHISNRIAVMYLGQIVEIADKDALYQAPLHPYSQALLSAIPITDPTVHREKILLKSEISFNGCSGGCRFADRCWRAAEQCRREVPELKEVCKAHYVACHRTSLPDLP